VSDAKEELTTENQKTIESIASKVFERERALTSSSKGSNKKVSTPEIKETKIPCDTCGGDYPVGKFVDHRMAEIMKTRDATTQENSGKIKKLEEKGEQKTHHFDPECTDCKSGVEKLKAKPENKGGYHF